MDKPITMIINELKSKIINECNQSGLPPVILDLIMQGIYLEIHRLAEKQSSEEETAYKEAIKSEKSKEDLEGKDNESK